jgi:hypothetical protein
MTAEELVTEIRGLGFELRADPIGQQILIRPPGALPVGLKERLREHKAEVLALLSPLTERLTPNDPEVMWRVAVMRRQVPPAPHAIGFLLARPELRDAWRELGVDHCHSCGDPLPLGARVHIVPRCAWCCRAAERACNERREGVPAGGAT